MNFPTKLSELIDKLDKENVTFSFVNKDDVNTDNFRNLNESDVSELLKYDCMLPYCSVIKYKKYGIIFTGECDNDPELLIDKLTDDEKKGKIFSMLNPLLYKKDKIFSFFDDKDSHNYPFFAPILFPGCVEELKIDYVFNLNHINSEETIKEFMGICSPEEKRKVIEYIVFDAWRYNKSEESVKLAEKFFEELPFYNIQLKNTEHFSEKLNKPCNYIRRVLKNPNINQNLKSEPETKETDEEHIKYMQKLEKFFGI